ncbi:unnamed protein product [Somion occarium]|uniref:SAP domain-containing protein n=1 Tax=Somion occarium TaxID=3059160 RepID=A0ABP1CSK9_9APHY
MSSNANEATSQAKPKSILKNKSSATTLVDPHSTNTSTTAASTPVITEHPSASGSDNRDGDQGERTPHSPFSSNFDLNASTPNTVASNDRSSSPNFAITPPVPGLPPIFTRLGHMMHHTHEHSHTSGNPPSPYSPSFDPNVSNISLASPAIAQPAVPPRSNQRPTTAGSLANSHSRSSSLSNGSQAQEQWSQIMSASLSALAAQFNAASHAFMTASGNGSFAEPKSAEEAADRAEGSNLALSRTIRDGQETVLILQRLEAIEKTQSHVLSKIAHLESSTSARSHPSATSEFEMPKRPELKKELEIEEIPTSPTEKDNENEKEKLQEVLGMSVNQQELAPLLKNLISRLEGVENRLEGMEGKVESLSETIRIDQARLYPRLLNGNVPLNKNQIHPLPMANGKAPPNFPATKGEFEHLTKERYESLLKSYGVPIKGDTNAKRQTLREFIGLTPPGK